MALRTWNGSTTSWNTPGNWLEGQVPTAADDVVFSDQSAQNCICDVAIDILSIDVQSTFAGTLDFADNAYAHSIGGNATFDGSGEVDLGNATITVSGNLDYQDQTTWVWATSTVVMDGTGVTWQGRSTKALYNFTVSGTVDMPQPTGGWNYVYGALTISGTLNLQNAKIRVYNANASINVTETGTLTSTVGPNNEIVTSDIGTITCAGEWSVLKTSHWRGVTIGPGTYGGEWNIDCIQSRTITMGTAASQTITFTGDFNAFDRGGSPTIDCATHNPDINFEGSFTITENALPVTWNQGAGSITWTGSGTNTLTTPSGWTDRLEGITYNQSGGSLTLAGDLYTNSLTVQSGSLGSLDFATYTVDIEGDFICDGGGEVDLGSATITISGSLDSEDQATWSRDQSHIILDGTGNWIAGSNHLFRTVTVDGTITYSTASGFVYITDLNVNGTLTINSSMYVSGGDLTIGASGVLGGTGNCTVRTGNVYNTAGGEVSTSGFLTLEGNCALSGGTYQSWVRLLSFATGTTITLGTAGSQTINLANVTINSQSTHDYTADHSTNDPAINISGDIYLTVVSGSITWNTGSSAVTFASTSNQTITTTNWTASIGNVVINNTGGTVTLAGNFYSDSFTGTSGTMDLGGLTLTSSGSVAVNNPFNFAAAQTTSAIAVQGGTLALNGANGAQLIIDDIDFAMSAGVTGAATYSDVSNSTATGDADIDASDGTSNDLGGNTGWSFFSAAVPVIDDPGAQTGRVAVPFSLQMTASENPTSWSAINLPAGLSIDNAGLISGTPTTAQVVTASITATNADGDSDPLDVEFNIQVQTDITATNPYGSDGISFNWTVLGEDFWEPYTDIAVRYDFTDLSTMWEDEAGTQPASLDSVVARVDDLSGNGNHLIQSTLGARPTVVAVADGSGYALRCNLAHYFTTAPFSAALIQPNDVFFTFNYDVMEGVFETVLDGITSGNRHSLYRSSSTGFQPRMWAAVDLGGGGPETTDLKTWHAQFNSASSALYQDGGIALASGNAGGNTLTGLTVGARFAPSNYSRSTLRQLVINDGALPDVDRNAIGNKLATDHGLTWNDISYAATVRTSMISSPQILGSDWAAINQWDVPDDTAGVEALQWIGFRIIDAGTYVLDALIQCDPSPVIASWVERDNPTGEVIFIDAPYNPVSGLVDRIELPTLTRQFQSGDEVGIGVKATESGSHIFNLLEGSWLRIATT